MSHNLLESLDGVQALPQLSTLNAASNRLRTLASLAPLTHCAQLSSLDVTDNELDGHGEQLVALLTRLPSLRALYLSAGNPVVAKLRPYRKRLIAALPGLAYLDDRPVFDAERRAAEAWSRGGDQAELAERQIILVRPVARAWRALCGHSLRSAQAEKEAATRANFEHITSLRLASKARRRAAAEARGETLSEDEVNGAAEGSDDERDLGEVDPPELVRARETLAQYPPVEGEEEHIDLTSTREALRAAGRLGTAVEPPLRAWPLGGAQDEAQEREDELEALGRGAWAKALLEEQEPPPLWGYQAAQEVPVVRSRPLLRNTVLIQELDHAHSDHETVQAERAPRSSGSVLRMEEID